MKKRSKRRISATLYQKKKKSISPSYHVKIDDADKKKLNQYKLIWRLLLNITIQIPRKSSTKVLP